MNPQHRLLLDEIKKHQGKPAKHKNTNNYAGTTSFEYHVSNPVKWKIAKDWAAKNTTISPDNFLLILDSLNTGKSHEEKSLVGCLLATFPKLRSQIKPISLDKWLNNVHGWAEVDNLCQNNFQHQNFFADWPAWEKTIRNFSKDKNVHKRRASLVLLTGPVSHSSDPCFSVLALENIDRLKGEKDILITKAVSWLLRSLIKNHHEDVEKYLEKNKDVLPRIAIRETENKLKSGRKSGK
ncbi:DNA alkylation repair protein [Patescibacteria group bacterium]|nr:DNA alkylation repair protein [Patescibacteria group bacterium]